MKSIFIIAGLLICTARIIAEHINWTYKPKQFVQIGTRVERNCQTNAPLASNEQVAWILYYRDGRISTINTAELVIQSFAVNDEGIAICQIKDENGQIREEKHFVMTSDPTELIDYAFEGYDRAVIESDFKHKQCGPDKNIDYAEKEVFDFHVDFVQHYVRIRQHSNYIEISDVKHEHEGYYECIVRLYNGFVGVRVFFLTVGGGPRQISNRETSFHVEQSDSTTLLCPIFSALPAWYTFQIPDNSADGVSALTGYDYIQIKNVSYQHSGKYSCRVTTTEDIDGYSLMADFHVYVFGPPEYVEPFKTEYVLLPIERNIDNVVRCSIEGNPSPSYFWFSGDVDSSLATDSLSNMNNYVHKPKENEESGTNRTVTCWAKNDRGSRRQVFVLQLID